MRKLIGILIFVMVISFTMPTAVFSSDRSYPIQLTEQEKQWLDNNRSRVFILGLDPYSGMDYFVYKGEQKGYVLPLADILQKDLGISIRMETSKSWGEVFYGLQKGTIDILFGANATPERKQYMSFTSPVNRYPYAIIAKKDGGIDTLGDLEDKTVGFIDGDIVMEMLPKIYKNINYATATFYSQTTAIQALSSGQIDAFITSGGPIVYDYIYGYPDLKCVAEIQTVTSDMTLSTRKADEVLVGILDKEILYLQKEILPELINQAEVDYYRNIMNLTDAETAWLKRDGKAVVGITKDYLPFDYYENGQYKGISGEIINEISRITGIKFEGRLGDFDELYEQLKRGDIDILNIAKTDEREKLFYFPRPYSTERDIIVGSKDSEDVMDVFGLEGKSVAVIKGFWHYEYLRKNLSDVKIVETNNIEESMQLVHRHKVDYLIENPSVVKFYVDELMLYDLVEKGVTSKDSYLYYGINRQKPELASIIDKAIPLLNVDKLSNKGYREVPHVRSTESRAKLVAVILGLVILTLAITLFTVKLIRDLIKEKTKAEVLRQREQLLYTDALTGVPNRNYFNSKVAGSLDSYKYPQSVIVTDMNNLKVINDKYGHHAGDELLKLFADILRRLCPEGSVITRMGGDEFLVVLENTDEEAAAALIRSIKELCCSEELLVEHGHFAEAKADGKPHKARAQAAFGYATRYSSGVSLDEMLRTADKDMYKDKRSSKLIRDKSRKKENQE